MLPSVFPIELGTTHELLFERNSGGVASKVGNSFVLLAFLFKKIQLATLMPRFFAHKNLII
jgi:hypothetical protein